MSFSECKILKQNDLNKQIQQLKIKKVMEKEIKYVAPQAEVLSAQVEKGFADSDPSSGRFDVPDAI